MRHKTTQAIFNYWDTLRHRRPAPLRSEIDPADIRPFLPDLFILELEEDGGLRFRLAGTRLCLLMGREFTRKSFECLWSGESLARGKRVGDAVLAKKYPALLSLEGQTASGLVVPVEMLLLPVFTHPERCDRIFGSLVRLMPENPLEGGIINLAINELQFIGPGNKSSILKNRIELSSPKSVALPQPSGFGQFFTKILHLKVFEGGRRD